MEAGTAIAIGQVSAKILSIVWKYYSDVKDAKSDVTTLLSEIQDLRIVATKLEESIQKDTVIRYGGAAKDLEQSLNGALKNIEELEKKLDPGAKSKVMKRVGKRALKWPFTKGETEKRVGVLRGFKASMNLAMTMDQTSHLRVIDSKIEDVRQEQHSNKQEDAFRRLSVAFGAMFDSKHQEHESRCLEDTRVELLAHLEEWGASHPQPIFWLSGMAGTGKSTISRTLATIFREQNILGGSFFFSRSSGEANNADRFIGTLAYSLCKVSAQLKSGICEAITTNEEVLRQGLRSQWRELIIAPLLQIKTSRPLTLNFVVDALDECSSDNDIRLLIQLFVELKDVRNIEVGLFVTSRPEVVIRLGFEKVSLIYHQKLDLRDIPRKTIEHDIALFVNKELNAIGYHHKLLGWPEEAQSQVLVKLADCLFIFAATACRFIGDLNWSDPVERLSSIIQHQSTSAAESGAHLAEMYTQVLNSCLINGQTSTNSAKLCERFKEVVGTIVILFDELSSDSLAQLLSRRASWVGGCLSSLHSVLNIPLDPTATIRLLHPSFRDFLARKGIEGDSTFRPNQAQVHSLLARKCLDAMSSSLNKNLCDLPSPGSDPMEADRDLMDEMLPKHVRYACCYWVDHVECAIQLSATRGDVGFCEDSVLHDFFKKTLLHWLEAMSLLRLMDQSMLMMKKMLDISKANDCHVELSVMIEDSYRFILANKTIIMEAPLQVYVTALIFSPRDCTLRQYYEVPTWITKKPSTDRGWNSNRKLATVNYPRCPTFAPRGDMLAVIARHDSANTEQCVLIDTFTGREINRFPIPRAKFVDPISISSDWILATNNADGMIRLWDPILGIQKDCINASFKGDPRWGYARSPEEDEQPYRWQLDYESQDRGDVGSEGDLDEASELSVENMDGVVDDHEWSEKGSELSNDPVDVFDDDHEYKEDGEWEIGGFSKRISQPTSTSAKISLAKSKFLPCGDLVIRCADKRIRIWKRNCKILSDPLIQNSYNEFIGVSDKGILIKSKGSIDQTDLLFYDRFTQSIERVVKLPRRAKAHFSTNNILTIFNERGAGSDWYFESFDLTSNSRRPFASLRRPLAISSLIDFEVSLDGRYFTFLTEETNLYLCDVASNHVVQISFLFGYEFTFCPSTAQVAILDKDGVVIKEPEAVLETDPDKPIIKLKRDNSPLFETVLVCREGDIRAFDLLSGTLRFSLEQVLDLNSQPELSNNQQWLAYTKTGSRAVHLYRIDIQSTFRIPADEHDSIDFQRCSVVFSQDDRKVALAFEGPVDSSMIQIWDLETQSPHSEIRVSGRKTVEVPIMVFSYDGSLLATLSKPVCTDGGTCLCVYSIETGLSKFPSKNAAPRTKGLAFTRTTNLIAFESEHYILTLIKADNGQTVGEYQFPLGLYIRGLAFSPTEIMLICFMKSELILVDMIGFTAFRRIPYQAPNIRRDEYQPNPIKVSNGGTHLHTPIGDVLLAKSTSDLYHQSDDGTACWQIIEDRWVMEGDRKMVYIPGPYNSNTIHCHKGHVGMFDRRGEFVTMSFTSDKTLTMQL